MTAWINDYVGVPYAVNGRDRAGWDCWGLVLAVFKEQRGLVLPDWRQEPKDGRVAQALAASESIMAAQLDLAADMALKLDKPEAWAVILVERRNRPAHAAVIVDEHYSVLHCIEPYGTVCEPLRQFVRTNPKLAYWRWTG